MMTKSNDLLGKILNYGPSQNTLFLVLSKLKEEGRLGEVVQECHKALSLYPDDLRLRTLLAETYGELGFIGLAETELVRVTSRLTDLIPAYKLQAEIYNQQQKNAEALEALNKYLAHRPDDPGALDLMGKIMALTEGVTPEKTKDMAVFDQEEEKKIEEKPVMETKETTEDSAASQEKEPEGEEILESVEIPEDISKVLEEKLGSAVVSEGLEAVEDALPNAQEEGGEVFADLATPELAEIYYNQGQIEEAISTYEFVILNNPDDKASTARLAELKASKTEEPKQKVTADDILASRKERMITVLEQWLTRIRELRHG